MPLTIETRIEDGVAIFDLAGQLTLGPSLLSLRHAARDVLADPTVAGIILRVGSVTNADSSGLSELTIVYTAASKRGCPMRLVEVNPNLQKMLVVTHLNAVLIAAQDVPQAKKELKGRPN
ncbi:MAG: STAS domain-containing protein [Acidobacteriaceae bacterium]|nr:STAS domain-containing protein [Acidobacteriaceae bacterium]